MPEATTPFGGQLYGPAIFYFGIGRYLYFGAPIFVGWGVALVAARQRIPMAWPLSGLILTALAGAAARVHAIRPIGGTGHVSMDFTLGSTAQSAVDVLLHALITLSLTALPYLIWRFGKAKSLAA